MVRRIVLSMFLFVLTFLSTAGYSKGFIVKSPQGLVGAEHLYGDYYYTDSNTFVASAGQMVFPNRRVQLIEPSGIQSMGQAAQGSDWGIQNVNAPGFRKLAAENTALTRKIKVAVVDTGGCFSHPDLKTVYAGGFNGINQRSPANDDNGHGCHVSGTIAGPENYGVAGGFTTLFAAKFLNSSGSGDIASAIRATKAALDWGAEVVSNSWGGGDGPDEPYEDLIKPAMERGVIFVFAAGNNGADNAAYPSSISGVISVAAHNKLNRRSSFSNFGSEVAVSLPGEGIYSSWNNGAYKTISGTSMAAPHMAGVIALLLKSGLSPNEILPTIRAQYSSPASWVDIGRVVAP